MTSNQTCNSVWILQAPHISYQTAFYWAYLAHSSGRPCSRIQITGWKIYCKEKKVSFLTHSHQQLSDKANNCIRDSTTGPVPTADHNPNSHLCPEVILDNQPSRQDSRTKIDVFRDFAYGKSLDEEESSCASKTYNIMKKISSEEAGARSTEDELKPSLPKAKSDHPRVPIQMKLLSWLHTVSKVLRWLSQWIIGSVSLVFWTVSVKIDRYHSWVCISPY